MRRVYHLHPQDLRRYTPAELNALARDMDQQQLQREEAMRDGRT